LMLILGGGCASPQPVVQPEAPVETPQTSGPKIEFESVEYDFGEVVPRAKAVGLFTVKNAGGAPLEISEVQKCCGATLNWSKKTLKPGESSELEVTYTFLYVGAMKKNLYVSSNDPNDLRIMLTIKGSVVRKVSWTPTKIKLFLNQENAGVKPIQIKSLDGKSFAITQFKASGDLMRAQVDPKAQATEFTIVPEVDVEKLSEADIPRGSVQIFHTHPGAQTIRLNYDLFPRFSFTPPRIIVFSADPERKEKRKLWILDNYVDEEPNDGSGQVTQAVTPDSSSRDSKLDFEIESVRSKNGSVTVSSTDPIKNGYQLSLEISPPEPEAGSRSFNDTLQIKIKDGKELSVMVSGYYSNNARSGAK
jgi:hypothetical protein